MEKEAVQWEHFALKKSGMYPGHSVCNQRGRSLHSEILLPNDARLARPQLHQLITTIRAGIVPVFIDAMTYLLTDGAVCVVVKFGFVVEF